ncbi:hypothetical protein F2Q68_00043071 [Brassica cretica]|uniref:Uncharacterized protein n=1 Tax=Brassica cretica TaxID=69181 RepID=A0A8S9LQ76_BRACR|nr:hypothetical protein F2Q68_00043071 [Brassica cretica]
MSGYMKDKLAALTAPMANAYANATVLQKIENLAATFCHRKCNETSSRFLFLNIKGNNISYQTPRKNPRLIAEKRSTANRVHNSPLYFFRLSCGKALGRSRKKGSTANLIETWITKTANIDSSLNTARKAEKSRKNLYSCYSKWADRHEKSKGK